MDLPCNSPSVSKLQRLKSDLKQWEREFQKQNGRVPAKQDIQASTSIHSLYREYARMKLKIQKESGSEKNVSEDVKVRVADGKENAHNGLPGDSKGTSNHTSKSQSSLRASPTEVTEQIGDRVEQVMQLPNYSRLNFAASTSNSEDSEDGSYISATPPKRGVLKLEQQSTPVSSYRPLRRPLLDISTHNSCNRAPTSSHSIPPQVSKFCQAVTTSKRKTLEIDAVKKRPSFTAMYPSKRVLSPIENTLPVFELPQEPGFVIKRRRPGMLLDEQNYGCKHEALPAGFLASVLGSSLIRKEIQNSRDVVNENAPSEVESSALGESATVNADLLRPPLGTVENIEARGDTLTTFSSSSKIDPEGIESTQKLQEGIAPASQPLSSEHQSTESAETSQLPAHREVDDGVKAKDLDRESSGEDLQKLTVVVLKQMLLRLSLPLTGNKSVLVSRLRAAMNNEGSADYSLPEIVDGNNFEQKQAEEVTAECQFVEQRKRKTSRGREKEESEFEAEEGDVKLSHGSLASLSLRRGKAVIPSASTVSTRARTRSGRCAVSSDGTLPSSLEKIPHNNSDSHHDAEVAGSTPSSREVKKRSRQDRVSPVIQQNASCEIASANCSEIPLPDVSCPEKLDPSESRPGEVNDAPSSKMSSKKHKHEKPPEEHSWAKPKALQRRPPTTTRKANNTLGRSSHVDRVHIQALKPSERNNFVKLNLNGRGGGRRKFVNKTRFRKPGAYGRRGFRGKKNRRPTVGDEANDALEQDLLHADEVDNVGSFERKGSRSNRTKFAVKENDTWLEAVATTFTDLTANSKFDQPPGLSEALERVLHDPSEDNLLEVLDMVFGFKSFRAGQLEAVKRILALQSTMVMLPTGAGKSLCYQLPALVLPGVTLVISPLIALMNDQLRHLPPSLPGALMSSAQTLQESSSTVARLRAGQIKVLFISPERLCSESFQRILGEIPNVNLAVIDEAHCLSEWSHNFRPSYFRLGSILLEQMKVPCVLAMTATATKKAERSIMEALRIPSTGLVQASRVRENLVLTVSKEPNRLRALLSMLKERPYSEARSIIIYCTFQVEADNISDFLQQNGIQAKSYHAKKTSQERSRIFEQFCSNGLRVVVATVAFGMGLDKSDVRAVIHYNIPRSLEHYVQETGRAGRDGKPAFCHLFLDDNDYLKLRSLAHSEGVDEYAVGKVLSRIFSSKESSKVGNPCSIIIETATKELDMKEEVLETVLSYLEVGDVQYVKSVSKLNVTCTLSFHRSSPASLAETSSHVAAILKRSQEKQGRYVFDLLALATYLQTSMFDLQFELRRLQAAGEITCEYGDPALCFTVLRFPEDVGLLTFAITKRLNGVEKCKVRKVDAMYTAALAAVQERNGGVLEESNSSLSSEQASFQNTIKLYFDEDEGSLPSQHFPSIVEPTRIFLRADIKDFIRSNKHANLTGRAVARIFHGIWSPAFPYPDWSKNHSWGKYEGVDFGAIKETATAELLSQHSATRVLQNS